jgi:hypothetical protein
MHVTTTLIRRPIMDEIVSTEPAADATGGASREVTAASTASETPRPAPPEATFKGNAYDLAALGALTSGVVVLFSCLTCNMGFYCLPLLPLVLGLIGLLSARQSVEEERTRLWSWLGIAAGGFIVLLIIAGIALYIAFVVLAVVAGQGRR